ncbi:MAG: SUMF1/EgtB/PvdO family nonheme iron enzyme, partial [Methanomicrobiales archaeon]|nr:SUMF1/EgtB/PvdO family nonheme iron enzyme [Methanomicrobiales archaeon]
MKKRQKIALCILCFLFASTLLASNEFIIESFKALPNDMAGSVYAKKDGNNEFCGLIKVKTGIKEDLDFSSSLKFNLFEKKKPGEYWVYVSPGEGRLTLYAEGFTPKHFHITSEKIESKRSYELLVRAKEEQKIPVSILTDQVDAEKWLDGELLGTGDNFQVVPGKYRLSIKKEGYKEYSAEVLFDKDNALIKDIELKQIQPVEVHITSSPLGTDIYIDNTLIGKTNKGTYLYPGTYSLKLSQSGYVDINEKIVVKETAKNTFNYNLEKNTGIMRLKISPPDAKVLINKTEHTGKKELEFAPGRYLLEVSKPGYYEDSKVIELKRGETAEIVLSLIQKTGNFQLSIGPLEAACRLMQGEKVIQSWTGMKRINDLPVGDYELLCTADKHQAEKRTFSIIENSSTVLDIQMQEGVLRQSSDYRIKEVFVQGGSFRMGDVWGGGFDGEKPIHNVTLSSFYIGKYEVTQALYKEIMGNNPSYFKGDNLPVVGVTWYNAVEFCNKLSEKAGLQKVYTISGTSVRADFTKSGYRLPTEAEWEYAARSGGREDRKWSGTNTEGELGNYAWYDSNSGNKTHPVGTKKANDLGIYDMSGNVYEWCWDWKGNYSSFSQTNPTGPST